MKTLCSFLIIAICIGGCTFDDNGNSNQNNGYVNKNGEGGNETTTKPAAQPVPKSPQKENTSKTSSKKRQQR